MANAQQCSQCGAELDPGLPRGLCGQCLISLGLASGLSETVAETSLSAPRAHPSDPSISPTLGQFGDYELIEEIARGGMGVVYRARQLSLGRIVAVKMILAGQFVDKKVIQRFRGEVTAAALLQHPNIVSVHEVGIHAGQHFFSMEYVEGQNLTQLVGDRPLPPKKAAHYLKLISEAIHYAHSQGILHRDLKPSNVLICAATNQPRVTDFGLAKRLDGESSLTVTGQVLGSPSFMPPEQASPDRGKVGRRSDVYALGAILYHLLTARSPFQAESLPALVTQVLNTEPIPPRLLNPSVPRDLETICLKCLEKEPARRYSTAKELADELGCFLKDEPIRARPVTRVERAWRWCRRKPALASSLSLAVALLLVLGIGGPIAAFRINQERRESQAQAYTSDMNVVLQAWEEGDLKRAQDLLRTHIPKASERDLRGFEWRYLWKLCQDESLHTIRRGTNEPIWRLATSPAHRFVAACGGGIIKLLEGATGQELDAIRIPEAGTGLRSLTAACAPGATNILAVHIPDGVVILWDLTTKNALMKFKAHDKEIWSLALSPDANLLATSDDQTLSVWDVASRTNAPRSPVWSHRLDMLISVAKFSPDGQTLVAPGKSFPDGTIGAWEVRTGRELAPFPKQSVGLIGDVAFSPDGTLLATSGVESRINVWDFTNRTVKFYFDGHLGPVKSLAFSPDGRRLISGGDDGTVRIWEISSPKPVGILRDPLDRVVRSVAYAPDGKSIVSTTGDEVKIWNTEPRHPAAVIETRQEWGWPAISPDGNWLVTGATVVAKDDSESQSAKVWDLASRQQKF